MLDDDSLTVKSAADSITTADLQKPILVGYAFGPKKMSTMATVMAEASCARVVGVSDKARDASPSKINTLTSEALCMHQMKESKKNEVAHSTGLDSIIRYFHSSCPSVGSDDVCALTSTTGSLTNGTFRTSTTPGTVPVRLSFVPIDLNEPLEEQHGGCFDIILHKMTEDILSLSTADALWRDLVHHKGDISNHLSDCKRNLRPVIERIHRLKEYQRSHPHCCLADDPSRVEIVMSRSAILLKLQSSLVSVTSASGLPVETPKFISCENTIEIYTLLFPLIAKPLTAAGTKKSHCMGIVLNQRGLSKVQMPCILQEYANHNGTLYKVYVLGDDTHVFSRPSLPNLPSTVNELCSLIPYVEFDSQRPYPGLSDFGLKMPLMLKQYEVHQLTKLEIAPVVVAMKRAFGLELFGFDIIVSKNKLLVVDVNYFPSFKEVSNFPSLLAKFLVQLAVQRRKLDGK